MEINVEFFIFYFKKKKEEEIHVTFNFLWSSNFAIYTRKEKKNIFHNNAELRLLCLNLKEYTHSLHVRKGGKKTLKRAVYKRGEKKQASNEKFLVYSSRVLRGDEGANVAESHDEEGHRLNEEVEEEVVAPECDVVAPAEEEVAASHEL